MKSILYWNKWADNENEFVQLVIKDASGTSFFYKQDAQMLHGMQKYFR